MSGISLVRSGTGSALAVAAVLAAGCGGDPAEPVGDRAAAGSDAAAVRAPKATGGSRPLPAEPVTFFRALAPDCRAFAKENGRRQVEAARFIRASFVDGLGGGAYLIRDGFGTRLVVRPGDRVVLPPSGRETDAMPAPYSTGCPPEVFKGAR